MTARDIFRFIYQLETNTTLIMGGVIILIGTIVFKFAYEKWQIYARRVIREKSTRLNTLLSINQEMEFITDIKEYEEYTKELPNKRAFDKFDVDNLMMQVIDEKKDYYIELEGKLKFNRSLNEDYLKRVKEIPENTTAVDAAENHIPIKFFSECEQEFFDEIILKPIIKIRVKCNKTYTSPQGRITQCDYKMYGMGNIQELSQKKREIEVTRDFIEYERSLVDDSLRYDVMKRDGFKCQICGCTVNDGVKLHVDHIKPVSKGGRTVMSNLRTLCERCNLGKRAKYDPDGLN